MKTALKKLLQKHRLLKKVTLDPYVHINYWRVHYWVALKAMFLNKSGTITGTRDQPIIVSLTTMPIRLSNVHLCIERLLEQTLQPDKIILWLPDELEGKNLPKQLKKLKKRGLSILYCEDLRSYKKLVPTLIAYPQAVIVTADDDFFYPKHWLEGLVISYEKEPEFIHCYRAHYMIKDGEQRLSSYKSWQFESPGIIGPSVNLMPTTGAGCLFPPESLHKEVTEQDLFRRMCPTADDIWFKAMALKKGTKCKKVHHTTETFRTIRGMDSVTLWSVNRSRNDEQIKNVFDYYGLYEEIV